MIILFNNYCIYIYIYIATTYLSSYLVLLFGFTDANKSADTISILDIKNPYHPIWVTNSASSSSSSTNTTNNSLPPEKLIPIVVCVCVTVLVK